MLITFEIEKE